MENETKEKIKRTIAPDVETRKEVRKTINDSAYYVMILLVSLLVVFIPPIILGGLTGDFATQFPKTPLAWAVWTVLNVSTAIGNMSILVFFKLQAKKNCKDNPNYKRANEILNNLSGNKEIFIPRSPEVMNRKEYMTKSICIIISTFASFFAIASLVINFSLMSLLSCLVSVVIALIMSWTTMLKNEEYWTEEYLLYALMREKQIKALESPEKGQIGEDKKEEEVC